MQQHDPTMESEAKRIARVVLREMPVADQVRTLVAAIVARKGPDPLRALVSLNATMAAMASFLNERDRFVLAEIVRDSADVIERPQEEVRRRVASS